MVRRLDLVKHTAMLSTAGQIFLGTVTLIIGCVGLSGKKQGSLLITLFITDVVVQAIELTFYVVFIYVQSLPTAFRYVDWYVSTPIMLVSTLAFLDYLVNENESWSVFVNRYERDIAFVVVMNALMLSFGLFAELNWIPTKLAVSLGFLPFSASFVALYTSVGHLTAEAATLLSLMCLVWAGYGVAALFSYVPKNIAYNTLDIVSKNFYGVILSVYLL